MRYTLSDAGTISVYTISGTYQFTTAVENVSPDGLLDRQLDKALWMCHPGEGYYHEAIATLLVARDEAIDRGLVAA
jgi:hypothetical protein